jgi:hypothetical protein
MDCGSVCCAVEFWTMSPRIVGWLENMRDGAVVMLSRQLHGGNEENHIQSRSSGCPGRNSKRAVTAYEFRALPLSHPLSSNKFTKTNQDYGLLDVTPYNLVHG